MRQGRGSWGPGGQSPPPWILTRIKTKYSPSNGLGLLLAPSRFSYFHTAQWGLFWTFLRVDVNKHESSHIMFLGINECGKIPPVQQLAHLGWRSLVYCNFSVEFLGLQSFDLLFDWLKKYWNMSFYIERVLLLSWNDSIAFISKVETVASIVVMHLWVFFMHGFSMQHERHEELVSNKVSIAAF